MKIIRSEPETPTAPDQSAAARDGLALPAARPAGATSSDTLTQAEFKAAVRMKQLLNDPDTDAKSRATIRDAFELGRLDAPAGSPADREQIERPVTPEDWGRRARIRTSSAQRLTNEVLGQVYTGDFEKQGECEMKPGQWPKNEVLTQQKFRDRPLFRDIHSGIVSPVSNYQVLGRDSDKYAKIEDLLRSNYPHWTPAAPGQDDKLRPAHFTDCVAVGMTMSVTQGQSPSQAPGTKYELLARTHQDDERGSKVTLDRLFAIDGNGNVFKVKLHRKPGVHFKKNEADPQRGVVLSSDTLQALAAKYTFTISGADEKTPHLSPDSRQRVLPSASQSSTRGNRGSVAQVLFRESTK